MSKYPITFVGTCNYCGKRCFRSRKDAKTYAKTKNPTAHWSVYQCGEYWHFGHMPKPIQSGKMSRSTYGRRNPPNPNRRRRSR